MKRIADTGLLAAALDKSDPLHSWGADELQQQAPFYTCDAVLVELAFVLGDPVPGFKLVVRGDLLLDFDLSIHAPRVLELLEKYSDRSMDVADACLVCMTEQTDRCKIWTVDQEDFCVYRRHGRQAIPCEFPRR